MLLLPVAALFDVSDDGAAVDEEESWEGTLCSVVWRAKSSDEDEDTVADELVEGATGFTRARGAEGVPGIGESTTVGAATAATVGSAAEDSAAAAAEVEASRTAEREGLEKMKLACRRGWKGAADVRAERRS